LAASAALVAVGLTATAHAAFKYAACSTSDPSMAGVAARLVADMLGHASPAITEGGSYIDRDRAAAAERGTALRMLADRLHGCANGRTRTGTCYPRVPETSGKTP
jgi:hypothetical protein